MSAYDVLPLWDGVSPLPAPVPTSPYTRDAAGDWRLGGRLVQPVALTMAYPPGPAGVPFRNRAAWRQAVRRHFAPLYAMYGDVMPSEFT